MNTNRIRLKSIYVAVMRNIPEVRVNKIRQQELMKKIQFINKFLRDRRR